jgi:hypothetical protein
VRISPVSSIVLFIIITRNKSFDIPDLEVIPAAEVREGGAAGPERVRDEMNS